MLQGIRRLIGWSGCDDTCFLIGDDKLDKKGGGAREGKESCSV